MSFWKLNLFVKISHKNILFFTSSYNFLSTYNWSLCFHKYLWIENSQFCLINAAREHFITQTGKKGKKELKRFMRPGDWGVVARRPTYGAESQGSRKTNTSLSYPSCLVCFPSLNLRTVLGQAFQNW